MTKELTASIIPGVADSVDELDRRLVAFNKEQSDWGSTYFTVELRAPDGELRGGAAARANLGVVEVSALWLDTDLRGAGWGRELVGKIVEEGRRLGAGKVLLDTYDFQARPFYEALGFQVFGSLDYPSGNSRYYLFLDI